MRYRPDLDGLRSLAVLPVVAFHMGFAGITPGGFVGVDVFFVISGYLITGIIYGNISTQTYSLTNFYNRRIRRIFPALFAVYGAVLIASLLTQFPSESSEVGKTTVSSIFFVSNVFFYNISSYFDQHLASNPLLHTWSLSVEEQFYVLFPLLVYAIRRQPLNRKLAIVAALALLSFGASAWWVVKAPSAVFYLVPFRAWELLVGSLLAMASFKSPNRKWVAESIGVLGVFAIVASVHFIDHSTPFPGPAALPACLGAAAVIYSGAGQNTLASRVLSLPPLRFIGLISYSLYLWHWPIYVFASQFHEPDSYVIKLALISLSILAATLSWWFIERPFRQDTSNLSDGAIVARGGAVMLIASLVALVLAPINQMIWRTPASAEQLLAYQDYDAGPVMRAGTCFLSKSSTDGELFPTDHCLKVEPDQKNILVIGDSHAAHLWTGLHIAYPHINFMQATASGCKPVLNPQGASRCTDLMSYMFKNFLPTTHMDVIILSARWKEKDVDGALSTSKFLKSFADKVIISGPILEYNQALPRVLALAAVHNENLEKASSERRRTWQKATDKAFASKTLPDGVVYFSAYTAIATFRCPLVSVDGVPVQFDYGHLTKSGSICIAQQFDSVLKSKSEPNLTSK